MSKVLVIPRIHIAHCNMLNAMWVVSPTPVMAINMFTHNLELKTGCKVDGVSIIHHNYILEAVISQDQYKRTSLCQFKGATKIDRTDYATGSNRLAAQPNAQGSIIISLVLDISNNDTIDIEKINTFLHSGKIAGGVIQSHRKIIECDYTEVFSHIKTGFIVEDRSDLITNDLDSLLEHLSYPSNGWMAATTIGYSKLTPSIRKNGVRNEFKHSFAEPLVSLIQYVSIHGQKTIGKFWKYHWVNDNTFTCNQ